MKVFNVIIKIVVAVAAIAGAIYVLATYGDKIVAWAKNMLSACKCCCCQGEVIVEEAPAEAAPEVAEKTVNEADFAGE